MGSVDLLEQKQYMIDGILGWKANRIRSDSWLYCRIRGYCEPGIDETEDNSEDEPGSWCEGAADCPRLVVDIQ